MAAPAFETAVSVSGLCLVGRRLGVLATFADGAQWFFPQAPDARPMCLHKARKRT